MPQKTALAWSLLLVLALLLGLLLVVIAFGVVRHLRRQRARREKKSPRQVQPPAEEGDFDLDDPGRPGRSSSMDSDND